MSDVAGILDGLKSPHQGAVVDFLVFIRNTATGITGNLDMSDELVMFPDPADEITVHDLDVIGIKEHLETG